MKEYPLVQDTISKTEITLLSKWLLKGDKLTKAKLTLEFEKKFSKYINLIALIYGVVILVTYY